jgi:hypothetical protein
MWGGCIIVLPLAAANPPTFGRVLRESIGVGIDPSANAGVKTGGSNSGRTGGGTSKFTRIGVLRRNSGRAGSTAAVGNTATCTAGLVNSFTMTVLSSTILARLVVASGDVTVAGGDGSVADDADF